MGKKRQKQLKVKRQEREVTARRDKAPLLSAEETQAEVVRYYTDVMNDPKQEAARRDKAAHNLTKLLNTSRRLEMRKVTRTNAYQKPVKQGKKQHRAEVAAETASEDNEWSHLIPKAPVVSLADRKRTKAAQ